MLVAERTALAGGLVCLVAWAAFRIDAVEGRHREMLRFAAVQQARPAGPPDLSLWSPERIAAWREIEKHPGPAPVAILRIPRIRLEVPVLEGTDDATLDRAVGLIEETAKPGTAGNAGIAGHRDGFFRGLKDLRAGDSLELEVAGASERYRVERIWIVPPEDVSVLDPTPVRSVTLVTCYPFYFIGPAPQRYIVRAVLEGAQTSLAASF